MRNRLHSSLVAILMLVVASVSGCTTFSSTQDSSQFTTALGTTFSVPPPASKAYTDAKANADQADKAASDADAAALKQPNDSGLQTDKFNADAAKTIADEIASALAPPVTAGPVCPNTNGTTAVNYTSSGSTTAAPVPQCESWIIRKAVDVCVKNTLSFSIFDQMGNWVEDGVGLITVAAPSIAAAFGASATVAGAIGSADSVLNGGSSALQKVLPSTAPTVTIGTMMTAGQNYLQLSNGTPANHDFYAGLWNAVGSACPPQMFKAYNVLDTDSSSSASSK
jgi:hypothetical protein